MAKAIVDPNELRKFATDLKRFTEELHTQMNVINTRCHTLGQTWKDQEHKKFMDEFEQAKASFEAACALLGTSDGAAAGNPKHHTERN